MSHFLLLPTGGPGDGLWPSEKTVRATCREAAGVTKGDVVQFTLDAEGHAEVDNNTPGSSDADGNNSGLNNFHLPDDTVGLFQFGVFGIAMEDIADGGTGEILVYGIVNANVDGSAVAGSGLVAATDGQLDLAGTTGDKVVAIALEADTSNFADVWFNGLTGWGTAVEA